MKLNIDELSSLLVLFKIVEKGNFTELGRERGKAALSSWSFHFCGEFPCISVVVLVMILVIQAALARGVTFTRHVVKVSGFASHGHSTIPLLFLKCCRHNFNG